MKKSPFYSLRTLSSGISLLPFGQAVAAQMPGVQLGGSGKLIWDLADECSDAEELVELALARMDVSSSERAGAETDIRQFIRELTAMGILENESFIQEAAEREEHFAFLKAGSVRVEFRGASAFFHNDFSPYLSKDFEAEKANGSDQIVAVSRFVPHDFAGLSCLLRNSELEVYSGRGRVVMCFPAMPDISAALLTDDGRYAVFCVRSSEDNEKLREDLFHAIRHAVLYRAQKLGIFALHSVSLLYRDRAWLFSAPAGTGKSTHTAFWQECFGTPVLNGDLSLLSQSGSGPLFCPSPWCGTSGISVNETHPLGGVIFLRRGSENRVQILDADRRQLRLANRLISPVWTESQLDANLAFADALCSCTEMWELECKPEAGSAVLMKAAIDRYLDGGSLNV